MGNIQACLDAHAAAKFLKVLQWNYRLFHNLGHDLCCLGHVG